jgi:PTS system mannose-specific IID component
MLKAVFWRGLAVFAGPCGGHYRQSPGWIMSMCPVYDRYYGDDQEARADAMVRHSAPYNITQNVGTFAMGLVASMEKIASEDPDYDKASIIALRTSLMGPMSGIGDAIYWGIVRCIAAGVGIGFSATGSIFGPLAFILIYNIPGMTIRYYLTFLGFAFGESFISDAYESGLITTLTKVSGIVGMFMIGFMQSSMVNFTIKFQIPVGEGLAPIDLQAQLDSILLGLAPMGLTFGIYWLLTKNVNQISIMFGVMFFAIFCGAVGIV